MKPRTSLPPIALALLFMAADASAAQPARQQAQRPAQQQQQGSRPRRKPTVAVETWNVRSETRAIPAPHDLYKYTRSAPPTFASSGFHRSPVGDPWEARTEGYKEGSTLSFFTQQRSQPLDLTQGSLQQALRYALQYKLQRQQQVSRSDPKQSDFTFLVPEKLEPHTPMKVTARSPGGRAYPDVHLNVQGRVGGGDGYSRDWVYTSIGTGGLLHPPYQVWTQEKNIFVSPPAPDGTVEVKAVAAFPAGAIVSVVNPFKLAARRPRSINNGSDLIKDRGLRPAASFATEQLKQLLGVVDHQADETGSVSFRVPARWLAGRSLKALLHFPYVADRAQGSFQPIEIGAAAHGAPSLLHEGTTLTQAAVTLGSATETTEHAYHAQLYMNRALSQR